MFVIYLPAFHPKQSAAQVPAPSVIDGKDPAVSGLGK